MDYIISKPLAIAKVNLGNEIEEVKIYQGDDIYNKSKDFCRLYKLPKQCIDIIFQTIMNSLSESEKKLINDGKPRKSYTETPKSPFKKQNTSSRTPERLKIKKIALKELGVKISKSKSVQNNQNPNIEIKEPNLNSNKFLSEQNDSTDGNDSFNSTSLSTFKNSASSVYNRGNRQFENILNQSSISSFEEEKCPKKSKLTPEISLIAASRLNASKPSIETPTNLIEEKAQVGSYHSIHKKKVAISKERDLSPLSFGKRGSRSITPEISKSPSKSSIKRTNDSPNTQKSKKKVSFRTSTPKQRHNEASQKSNLLIKPNTNYKKPLCSEGVSELFNLLDSDLDGFIDAINIDLSGIKFEVLEKFEALLLEIDQRSSKLNLLQFNKLIIKNGLTSLVRMNFGNQTKSGNSSPSGKF